MSRFVELEVVAVPRAGSARDSTMRKFSNNKLNYRYMQLLI